MKKPLLHRQLFGLGILIMMIGALYCVLHIAPSVSPTSEQDTGDSLFSTSEHSHTYQTYPKPQKTSPTVVLLQPFDPNTADSLTLIRLGLRPYQVKGILHYRQKGGVYRQKEDLLKLYGMNDSIYEVLSPYICIAPLPQDLRRDSLHQAWEQLKQHRKDSLRIDSLRRDSIYRSKHYHPKRDTLIEVNQADTSDLQYIRGIGPSTARKIIRYRKQLGGFHTIEQLRETPNTETISWETILPHLWVNPDSVHRIPVNKASIERLQRHPYIRFSTAKSIYTLRRSRVRLHDISELQEVLDADNLQRLRPYLDFSE